MNNFEENEENFPEEQTGEEQTIQTNEESNIEEENEENEGYDDEEQEDQYDIEEQEQPQESGSQIVITKHAEAKPVEILQEITLKPNSRQIDAWNIAVKLMKNLGMTDGTFKYNGNLHVCHMNQARVTLLIADIDMGLGFSQLNQQNPPVSRTFTVQLDKLSRALRMNNATFDIGQDKIVVSNSTTKINLPLIDYSDTEEVPEPKIPGATTVEINFKDVFLDITKYMGSQPLDQPDHLTIAVADGKAEVTTSTNFAQQSLNIKGLKATGPNAKATYGTQFLKALKDFDYDAKWKIHIDNDMPLIARCIKKHNEYSGTDRKSVEMVDAKLTVYVAPRVEQ